MNKQLTNKTKLKILNKLKLFCWASLIIAFILKILGVYYIDKGLNVEWLINLNEFVTNHKFIEFSLNCISSFYVCLMLVSAINGLSKIKYSKYIILIIISIIRVIASYLYPNIAFVLDILMIFVIPLICNQDKIYWYLYKCYIAFILMNVFQLLSLSIRLGTIKILDTNIIFNQIMFIDYYIMLMLYCLYSIQIKKGGIEMGAGGWLWFGNNIAMDKGYQKFIKTIYVIGVIITFPISIPYILCKKKQYKNKAK